MSVVIVSVVVALLVAAAILGIVVVGIRGDLPEVSERAPELAGRFEWAARKLNGDQPSGSDADLGPLAGPGSPTASRPPQPRSAQTRPMDSPAAAARPAAAPVTDSQATRMIPALRTPGQAAPPERPAPNTPPPRRSTLPPTGDFGAQ